MKTQIRKPYRFNLDGNTFQIDYDQTVWKLAKTQKGHEAFHIMLGPDADFILRHGRALQWIDASNPTRQDSDTAETFNEKEEHEKDLEHESRQDYESDQLAGNPPEQGE